MRGVRVGSPITGQLSGSEQSERPYPVPKADPHPTPLLPVAVSLPTALDLPTARRLDTPPTPPASSSSTSRLLVPRLPSPALHPQGGGGKAVEGPPWSWLPAPGPLCWSRTSRSWRGLGQRPILCSTTGPESDPEASPGAHLPALS